MVVEVRAPGEVLEVAAASDFMAPKLLSPMDAVALMVAMASDSIKEGL